MLGFATVDMSSRDDTLTVWLTSAQDATHAGHTNAVTYGLGEDTTPRRALSMICDTNRTFILLYPGYVTFNWDSITHTHDHHGLSHRTGDFTVGGACGAS